MKNTKTKKPPFYRNVTDITVKVEGCARCGQDHHTLLVKKFTNPSIAHDGHWTHWAICPALDEPLLVRFTRTQLK